MPMQVLGQEDADEVSRRRNGKRMRPRDELEEEYEHDLQTVFYKFTLESLLEIVFDHDLDTAEFSRLFDECQELMFARQFTPLWKLCRFLRCTDSERTIAHNIKRLNAMVEPLLLDTGRDMVMNFLLAGRDTTAALLTWTTYLILKHKLDQTRLVEDPTYLHDVLMESLRLYPPVPSDVKLATEDDVWPDGTRIAAGTTVVYKPFFFGRATEIWGEDASIFRPGRRKNHDQYAFPVFNAGRRLCLGKDMAITEAKIMLRNLLAKYTLTSVVADDEPDIVPSVTLKMKRGLWCRVVKKQNKINGRAVR